ncbi:MAG: hypothetical protein MUC63_09430, partial [Planctomycetes bacterium]|nr:hypothetical protein [Planctomycetota bacterium]
GRLRGLAGDSLRRLVGEGLDFADLGSSADRPVRTYSTGMARKTAVALAAMGSPELVVLDEPTAGLDPESVVRLRDAIRARRDAGTAFLVSSHHLSEMETLCSRVGILASGRLLVEGAPSELLAPGPRRYRIEAGDAPAAAREAASLPDVRVSACDGAGVEVELDPSRVPALVRSSGSWRRGGRRSGRCARPGRPWRRPTCGWREGRGPGRAGRRVRRRTSPRHPDDRLII